MPTGVVHAALVQNGVDREVEEFCHHLRTPADADALLAGLGGAAHLGHARDLDVPVYFVLLAERVSAS
jgi:hypothetical protein